MIIRICVTGFRCLVDCCEHIAGFFQENFQELRLDPLRNARLQGVFIDCRMIVRYGFEDFRLPIGLGRQQLDFSHDLCRGSRFRQSGLRGEGYRSEGGCLFLRQLNCRLRHGRRCIRILACCQPLRQGKTGQRSKCRIQRRGGHVSLTTDVKGGTRLLLEKIVIDQLSIATEFGQCIKVFFFCFAARLFTPFKIGVFDLGLAPRHTRLDSVVETILVITAG